MIRELLNLLSDIRDFQLILREMDGKLKLKKNFTEASGPSNELVLIVLKDFTSLPHMS